MAAPNPTPLIVFPILLGCASSMEIASDTHPQLATSEYETYALLSEVDDASALDAAVKGAVHRAMQRQGYVEADAAQADLQIWFDVVTSRYSGPGTPPAHVQMMNEVHDAPRTQNLERLPSRIAATEHKVDKALEIRVEDAKCGTTVWSGRVQAAVPVREVAVHASEAVSRVMSRLPRRM